MVMGGYLAGFEWFPHLPFLAVSAAGTVLFAYFSPRSRSSRVLAILSASFCSGVLLWEAHNYGPPGDPLSRYLASHRGERFTIEGRVRQADLALPWIERDRVMRVVLDVTRIENRDGPLDISGRMLLRVRNPSRPILADERIRVRGAPDLAISHVNPEVTGVETSYRRRGIHSVLRIYDASQIEQFQPAPWWSLRAMLSRFRHRQAVSLSESVPADTLPFLLAVWLGDRGDLTQEARDNFIRSGTAHILSVSGLHMAIVFAMVSTVLRGLVRRRRLRTVLTMAFVWAFAIIAGARIGSVRAAIMLCLYLGADLFDREPDAPTALSIAAILFLTLNPATLFDAGFLLSFLSVASLMLFAEPLQRELIVLASRIRRMPMFVVNTLLARGVRPQASVDRPQLVGDSRFAGGLPTALAVQILPFPVAIHLFHVYPILSPVANLLVVPLLAVTITLTAVTVVCGLILPPVAPLFGYALDPVVYVMETVTHAVPRTPGSFVELTSPTIPAAAFYWLAAALAVFGLRGWFKTRAWLVAAPACVVAAATWSPLVHNDSVVFLDVGHGDSTFIRSNKGATILIDGGVMSGDYDVGASVVLPFLLANHVNRLDLVVATHADADHMGGLITVINRVPVGRVVLGPLRSDRPIEAALLAACEAREVPVTRVSRGDRIRVKDLEFEMLHPAREWAERQDENDRSLVLRTVIRDVSFLFTGDIERAAEEELVSKDLPESDVLKVPHHGSGTSSVRPFVQRTAPSVAVISTGRRPGGAVISREIELRYGEEGARVMRTDSAGAVSIEFRAGGAFRAVSERDRRGYVRYPR